MRLNKQITRCIVLYGFGLFSLTVRAQALSIWDLGALVREAASQHPSVLNAQRLSDAADADLAYAQRQRYPEMTLSTLSQSDNTTAALVLRQPLWAGGSIEAAEQVSQASLDVQKTSAEEQALTIATRVLEAWQNYFLSVEKMDVVDQGLAQLQELVDMMQRRVDAQISPRVELELAQARVIQARIGRASLRAEADLAIKRLQELVGQPVSLANSGAGSALKKQWLNAIHKSLPIPSADEMEGVVRHQPTVRRVQFEALVAQAQIKQTEANRWPSLYLQYQQGLNQVLTNDKRLGLALEYTPGRGFSTREQVMGAVARAQARDINIQTAIRDARDALNAQLQEMARNQALERSWVPAVTASEKLLESYQRQFIAGRKSWQDVLNQQNELTQGRQSLLDARIRWFGAYVHTRLLVAARPGSALPGEDWQAMLQSPSSAGLSGGALAWQGAASRSTSEPSASARVNTLQAPPKAWVGDENTVGISLGTAAVMDGARELTVPKQLAAPLAKSQVASSTAPVLVAQASESASIDLVSPKAKDEVLPHSAVVSAAQPVADVPKTSDSSAVPTVVDHVSTAIQPESAATAPPVQLAMLMPSRDASASSVATPNQPRTALGVSKASNTVAVEQGMRAQQVPESQQVSGSSDERKPAAQGPGGQEEVTLALAASTLKPTVVGADAGVMASESTKASVQVAAPQWKLSWPVDVLFDHVSTQEAELSTRGRKLLEAWVDAMRSQGQALQEIRVLAYNDVTPSPAAERIKTRRMAERVSELLKSAGLQAQQWQALATDVAPCDVAAPSGCRHAMRRVEVAVVGRPDASLASAQKGKN